MSDDDYKRRCAIAQEMLRMPAPLRDEAIAAADNVMDARERFLHRSRQAVLARQYRRAFARKPGGAA